MSKPIKLNKVGIYMRLSRDSAEGESQSIENQRLIIKKYVADHNKQRKWTTIKIIKPKRFSLQKTI